MKPGAFQNNQFLKKAQVVLEYAVAFVVIMLFLAGAIGLWSDLPEATKGTGYSGSGTARPGTTTQQAGTGTINLDDYGGAIGNLGTAQADTDQQRRDTDDRLEDYKETDEWKDYHERQQR